VFCSKPNQEGAALGIVDDEVLAMEREDMLVYRHLSVAEESFKRQKSKFIG